MGEAMTMAPAIEGVEIQPLKQIKDERGMVMHMIRADSPQFNSFGEVYFSVINSGVIKAWKKHRVMTQNIAVPVGEIKLVIYDDRAGSRTRGAIQEIVTGVDHYALIRIPPSLWYGFMGLGSAESLIANCASIPHDPGEVERAELSSSLIPYRW